MCTVLPLSASLYCCHYNFKVIKQTMYCLKYRKHYFIKFYLYKRS